MKKAITLLLVFICILVLVSCDKTPIKDDKKDYSLVFSSMDTQVTIHIDSVDKNFQNAETSANEIMVMFNKFHQLTDNFKSYEGIHNVAYINQHPEERIIIEKELYDIIKYAEDLKTLTNGYFDISTGNIIDKWKWLINLEEKLTDIEFSDFLEEVSLIEVIKDGIKLEAVNNTYYIEIKNGVKIDLGAIAKGYAIEEANKIIKKYGIEYYQLKGSDSSVHYGINNHKDRLHFNVGLLRPQSSENKNPYYGILQVMNNSLTTSGDSIQGVFYGENRYHHIVSPITKKPENFYSMVTLLHPNAAYADAITTALMSMDFETATKFINDNNLNVIIYNFDETITNYMPEGIFKPY